MTHTTRPTVHVRENLAGWWDVTIDDGRGPERLAQYTSEFQAREAGRVNALRLEADLLIHQASAPTILEAFDETTGCLHSPLQQPPRD